MIQIMPSAQQHFRRLLTQQGMDGTGIRIRVRNAGTPGADCDLEFCDPQELIGDEWTVECEGFNLYVQGDSVRWLDGAEIDYLVNATGGELNIRAPKIRGEVPGGEAGLIERVRYVLDAEINPRIAAHGGCVSLIEVSAANEVVLRFGGGCHGCGMVDVTLKQGVEKTLRERIPEITAVRDATDHATGREPYYRRHGGKSALT